MVRPNFENAYLVQASFVDADLKNGSLKNTDIREADFTGADLSNVDMDGISDYKSVISFKDALILHVQNPPDGFIEWALNEGATLDRESHYQKRLKKNPYRYNREPNFINDNL